MTSARALANQKLYHAKILITAWRQALGQEDVAKSVLEQAFGAAICNHLARAYGWFLLEVAQPAEMPDFPPAGCACLPPVSEGRELPPEIAEFQQLEREAWLDHILHPDSTVQNEAHMRLKPQGNNLALQSSYQFGPDEAEQWHGRLNQLFDRMSDSLDEY